MTLKYKQPQFDISSVQIPIGNSNTEGEREGVRDLSIKYHT